MLLEFGLFDQIRIDHGSEFCLCIFVQRLLEHYRPLRAATRRSFFQTSSRTNTRAERIWPEENSRVTYHIKEVLVSMEEEEIIDMGDPATAFCVSTLTCRISAVGRENMINSWNHRRIAGTFVFHFYNTFYVTWTTFKFRRNQLGMVSAYVIISVPWSNQRAH